jgi:hypothetical protein
VACWKTNITNSTTHTRVESSLRVTARKAGLLRTIVILASAALAFPAFAQVAPSRINAIITVPTVPTAVANTTCAAFDQLPGGYDAICPSGIGTGSTPTKCSCVNIQNAKVTGNFKGTAQLLITEDLGSPSVTQITNNCLPFFGDIYITTAATKLAAPEIVRLNVLGADCDPINSIGPETLSGGFGLTLPVAFFDASLPPVTTAGFGTLNGTVNNNGVLRIAIKGPLSPASANPSSASLTSKSKPTP